jgi:hypothetical protein
MDGYEETKMNGPRWKYEANPNTVVSIVTLLGMIAGVGVIYQTVNSTLAEHDRQISGLQAKVSRIDDSTRASSQAISGLDYRVTSVESMAREAILANRETSALLAELKSDLRVAKEILVRLEATSNRPTR